MKRKWLIIMSCLTIVGLFAASCAPAVAPTPTPKAAPPAPTPTKVAVTETPAAKPLAPAPTPKAALEQPQYGGLLTGWAFLEPEHLDIHQANSCGTLCYMGPVYNSLLQHSPMPPHDIVPELAQSWEAAPDGKSYTFTLFPGIKWHDGRPFTAEDVKYSLDRMRDPPRGVVSPRKAIYNPIDKVEVLSPDKVRIVLQFPSPSIIEALSIGWSVMMPKHVIEARGGDMKTTALGTGPFKFREYLAGTQIALDKNQDYFIKGRPYIDGIRWYIIKDPTVQLAAFRAKRTLVTSFGSRGLTPPEVEIVKKEIPGVGVYEYPGGGSGQTMTFNVTKPPFSDLRARQAAALAIDQDEIVKVALQGGGQVTGPIGPPSNQWSLPEKELLSLPGIRKPSADDIAQARKLLAEAGYPGGLKTAWHFRVGSRYGEIAEVVKSQLARVGIDLTLQRLEATLFQDTQRKRSWDLIQTSHVGIMDDPDGLLIWFITDSINNFSGFSDKLVDELYVQQSRTVDPKERKRLVNQLERRLIEQAPMLRLFEWTFYFAHWPDLKGFKGVGVGPFNNTRWVDVWLAR